MARIGTSDLDIYPLGLGGNTFGMTTDAEASANVLDAFVTAGGNFIDTADAYSYWVPGNSGGESETIIGEWARRRGTRDAVVISTKVGGHPAFRGLAPDTIANAADASLRRLQTDYIDVYFAHYDDERTPIEDLAAAFDALVRVGKIRYVGVSNMSTDRIAAWIRTAQDSGFAVPVALQPQYSLVARKGYEHDIVPLAEAHQLGVLAYSSLANGFLTGRYRTETDLAGAAARARAVRPFLNAEGLRVIDTLETVAAGHHTSVATTALAWLLAKPAVTASLASATSVAQLSDLMAAGQLRLTADEVSALDQASQPYA